MSKDFRLPDENPALSLCTGDTCRGLHTDTMQVRILQATLLALLSMLELATSQQLPPPHSHWTQPLSEQTWTNQANICFKAI